MEGKQIYNIYSNLMQVDELNPNQHALQTPSRLRSKLKQINYAYLTSNHNRTKTKRKQLNQRTSYPKQFSLKTSFLKQSSITIPNSKLKIDQQAESN